ncbi:hypothetical protein MSAS_30760 [Mycobacterium saskatchewanense]|uniref:C45 family autoproteolytic acyltransferase/hydolase n=1 Tax=Mycobacterium saskatchewanense TaxID=220927 RepID=UPI00138D02DC|nr:C45 family peptidase [Mycobacterium saskatchewanense]BBX63902.1 hypothetical protein MSAS_30760 [Mycobacterium saskatchewanense]
MTNRFRSSQTLPYERGAEFGETYAGEVAATVAAYQGLFDRVAGKSVDLKHWGKIAFSRIARYSTELADEITGLAHAAKVPVASIAAINARTEVLAALGRRANGESARAHECSTVVRLRKGRAPLAVQAWDWYADLSDLWLVWEIPRPDGRLVTTVTEYGILGKIGVNNQGLGIHFNILHHRDDGAEIGVPVHILARRILDEARDLNHALTMAAQAAVSASSSLTLVATAGGESAAISVELNPAGVGYALPDADGLLVHTNHFLSTPANLADTELRNGPDTVVRHDMLRRALAGRPEITIHDVLAAMSSHLLGGGGTCCHVDPALPPSAQFQTLATVILEVDAGTLTVHPGGPCTAPAALAAPSAKEKTNAHA